MTINGTQRESKYKIRIKLLDKNDNNFCLSIKYIYMRLDNVKVEI